MTTTKTLSLSSPEGGSYVIVITLTKERGGFGSEHSAKLSPHLYHFLTPRNHYLLSGSEPESENIEKSANNISLAEIGNQQSTNEMTSNKGNFPRNAQTDIISSESFSNWTKGNDIDVLIDGLETFERMFEVPLLSSLFFNY